MNVLPDQPLAKKPFITSRCTKCLRGKPLSLFQTK
ncbi:hypothetical protein EVA_09212 [gut metagenome]|uniref:Uncharacterized protein n=1 Tax=gut metagenome TaxID=749906 RepID=J9G735_9ZZZZ